jgi:hypothetical protein
MFGAALTLRLPQDRIEEFLRATFPDAAGRLAHMQMRHIETVSPYPHYRDRRRKLSPKNLEDVVKESVTGEIWRVSFLDHMLSLHSEELSSSLELSLSPGGAAHETQPLVLDGPLKSFDQESIINYLRSVVLEFHVDYGNIVSGNILIVGSLTAWMGGVLWEDEKKYGKGGTADLQFADEVNFYQTRQDEFHKWVPRAAWGNILSEEHVAGLGGESRIRAECDCFLVQRWNKNLYIQLTESLADVTKQELLSLNQFLGPVRFPGAPDPVYF